MQQQHYTVIYVESLGRLEGAKRYASHSLENLRVEQVQAATEEALYEHVFGLLLDAWGERRLNEVRSHFFIQSDAKPAALVKKLANCSGGLRIVVN